ncbi:MAG: histidine kinase [Cellulomonas sp.]|nr:histidine kinase [Cellulomonas sp.]
MGVWGRVLAWSDQHRLALDAVGAVLIGLIAIPTATAWDVWSTTLGATGHTGAMSLTALAMVTPLAWRRVRPALSAAAVYTVALAHMLLGPPLILPLDFVVLIALWSVTVHGPRWAARVAIVGGIVGSVLLGVLMQGGIEGFLSTAIVTGLMMIAVWAIALVRRARREALDSLVDRARRLEVERDQQARLAAAAERSRIAREMHDIVAHSLSVMIAQADGGRYAAAADPQAATRSLETISETGRAALTDMRRLLGVLRTEAEPVAASAPVAPGRRTLSGTLAAAVAALTHDPHAEPRPVPVAVSEPGAPTGPLPAADDISVLVDQLRAGGMRASLVRLGEPRHLPPGAGLTLYRVAQESLTNVLKHAGPDPEVTVVLQWLPDTVVLEVSDDGRGAAAGSDGLGQGLLGMRERTTMFGGSVSAGPRPGGGFRTRATLPAPGGTAQAEGGEPR